jgi:hypothetical protein
MSNIQEVPSSILGIPPDIVVAFCTIVITFFTVATAIATWLLWRVTKDTVNLAREEFNSSHRPNLDVRNIYCEKDIEGNVVINLSIDNIGDAKATNICANILDEISDEYKFLSNPSNTTGIIYHHNALLPGQNWDITHAAKAISPLTIAAHLVTRDEGLIFLRHSFIIGHIEYDDLLGNRRRLIFRRRYDAQKERFVRLDDPEYEYRG